MRNTDIIKSLLLISILWFTACKKFNTVDPPNNTINADNVYAEDVTATAVLTGIYTNMSIEDRDGFAYAQNGLVLMSLYPALSADELTLFSGSGNEEMIGYYQNNLKANVLTGFWKNIYKHIFVINSAIAGINGSTTLTPAVKSQLLGEAYFMRAFCYFHLVNLYGDVPLILSTDYAIISLQPRVSKDQVYTKIIDDLKQAKLLLADRYLDASLKHETEERLRPSKFAAEALLARVYLYTGEWANAESSATAIIQNSAKFETVPLDEVFLKNSKETIWAIQPIGDNSNSNTGEGKLFIIPYYGPDGFSHSVYLSPRLLESFDKGDQRLSHWISSVTVDGVPYHFPYKYKIGEVSTATAEYPIILRLAEQYLIRAEARIRQQNVTAGIIDLNVLRSRANDSSLPREEQLVQLATSLSSEDALKAVLHERQVELFTEWGHRWLDLKRTNTIDAVMKKVTSDKGGTWDKHSALYPLPFSEVKNNPNLVQNPGY